MSKLLVMTDPHLVEPPGAIIGLDPVARLEQGLAHAAKRHADADWLIIMGDLTNAGHPAAYDALRNALSDIPWPVSLMLGNHDDRTAFRAAFPDQTVCIDGFVQSVVDLADVRVITLDSLDDKPTVLEAGRLCPARLEWLENALSSADRPCVVFIHHPPFQTGFAAMDAIGLQNSEAFREVLAKGPVAHVFAGHVHRTITATIGGVSMTTLKSTCHQMPMLLGKPGFGRSVAEPGAYGIILTRGRDVVVHFEDFTLDHQAVARFDT